MTLATARPVLFDDVGDCEAGAVLDGSGDCQRGEHDRQVCLDRVAGAVEHGPCPQVCFAHLEGLLDVP